MLFFGDPPSQKYNQDKKGCKSLVTVSEYLANLLFSGSGFHSDTMCTVFP